MEVITLFFCLPICVLTFGIIGLLIYLVFIYNSLMQTNVLVDEGWSGIDVQLKKRFDLIPNLVETVKGYARQEELIFVRVTELRSNMLNTNDPKELSVMEGEIRSALKSIFAVAENYPELKSNANFQSLHQSLVDIENDIEMARRYYNGAVRNLNQQIVIFPNNLIANYFKINKREFFELDNESERENIQFKF